MNWALACTQSIDFKSNMAEATTAAATWNDLMVSYCAAINGAPRGSTKTVMSGWVWADRALAAFDTEGSTGYFLRSRIHCPRTRRMGVQDRPRRLEDRRSP